MEAQAAATYWAAWRGVQVQFASRDADRIPTHWKRFDQRASPLTGSPRVAINPVNAVANLLYALLEAESSIALAAVGLDPGIGIMHTDQRARDSLALDLMEPSAPPSTATSSTSCRKTLSPQRTSGKHRPANAGSGQPWHVGSPPPRLPGPARSHRTLSGLPEPLPCPPASPLHRLPSRASLAASGVPQPTASSLFKHLGRPRFGRATTAEHH